jgi:hypothetical protein
MPANMDNATAEVKYDCYGFFERNAQVLIVLIAEFTTNATACLEKSIV